MHIESLDSLVNGDTEHCSGAKKLIFDLDNFHGASTTALRMISYYGNLYIFCVTKRQASSKSEKVRKGMDI